MLNPHEHFSLLTPTSYQHKPSNNETSRDGKKKYHKISDIFLKNLKQQLRESNNFHIFPVILPPEPKSPMKKLQVSVSGPGLYSNTCTSTPDTTDNIVSLYLYLYKYLYYKL